MNDISTITKKILAIVTTLQTKKARIYDWRPEELLSAALELSSLRVTGSVMVADYDTEVSFLELSAKEEEIAVYKKERAKGTSQKDSEILAKEATLGLMKEATDKKGQMKQLKELVDKSGDFITIIQTTIKRMAEEQSSHSLEAK